MNTCPNCHVQVDDSLAKCPLCREPLTDSPGINPMYPDIPRQKTKPRRSLDRDLYIFLTLSFITCAVILNLIYWDGTPWFLAIAVPLLYAWLTVYMTANHSRFFGTRVFFQLIGIMAVAAVIDYLGGWQGWSLTYVLPILLICCNAAMDLYAHQHPSRWKDSLVYALLFAALGCLPLIFYSIGWPYVGLLVILSTIASALTILGMLRFAVRAFALELKKRFHV